MTKVTTTAKIRELQRLRETYDELASEVDAAYYDDFCRVTDDFNTLMQNNAARMAEIIERTREFLGRRYELEGERTALIMLIDAFQNQEGKGG